MKMSMGDVHPRATLRRMGLFDRGRDKNIVVGDEILVLLPTTKNKINKTWKGPYRVVGKPRENEHSIMIKEKRKLFLANMIKKYHRRTDDRNEEITQLCVIAIIETENDSSMENSERDQLTNLHSHESKQDVCIGKELTENECVKIRQLIGKYSNILSHVPGTTNLAEHCINSTSVEPVISKPYQPYPLPYDTRERLKEQIIEKEDKIVIIKSSSEYASIVVIVKKKDFSDRICVDYRKLNTITPADPEPMSTADDLFQKMCTAKYFSALDMTKGFWRVEMNEDDIKKTTFVTPDRHLKNFKGPSFGLKPPVQLSLSA